MRPIDADALLEFIENRYEITWEYDNYEGGIKDACCDIIEKIDNLPTIEPERKRGKWSVEFSPAYKGGAYCECSQCNYKFAMGAYFEPDEWKFCPNCGADMRGEQDEY